MKNKPIFLIPSILVYKLIIWLKNVFIFFGKSFVKGVKWTGITFYKFIKLIGKGIKALFIVIYKAIKWLGIMVYKGIKYTIIGIYLALKFIVTKIYEFIKLVIKGIKYTIIGIYTLFKYIVIGIYKTIKYIIGLIVKFFILVGEGIKFTFFKLQQLSEYIWDKIKILSKYDLKGFKFISLFVYYFVSFFFKGIIFIFNFIGYMINRIGEIADENNKKKERDKKFNTKLAEERKVREEFLHKLKIEKERQLKEARAEALRKEKEEKQKAKERNSYVNENMTIEKKKLADHINDFLAILQQVPKKIKDYVNKKYNNLTFVKYAKNKQEMHREALLINFEGDDAKKSDKKVVYEYVARTPDGKLVKSYFEAFSKVEVHSFLLSEGYEVYSIRTTKWIQLMYGSAGGSHFKMATKDLIFFLAQLSTYIKSGITLVESLRILSHQYKKKKYQKMFKALIYDLTMGDNLSDALAKRGTVFPKLLINMVKASEMTGELPEALDDLEVYYTQSDKTRKQMVSAMMYPVIILVIAVAVVAFIMIYVIPRFVSIFEAMDASAIPKITLMILDFSNFLQNNMLKIGIVIVIIILIFSWLFKNVQLFRTLVQWILMHIPVISNIIIYNEITMFTKTFASLLKHNVFITDSMEILNKMTSNEIYKMIILDTITNLAKGEKISLAFKDHWAVPLPAYEMIVTGERTGQLAEMMQKVSEYYQELHANAVARLKTFIEPILIVFLTGVVGVIVLSIVIPMFSMYSAMG